MNFYYIMSVLIVAGGAISRYLFRKGGPYNPMASDDNEIMPVIAPIQPVQASSPAIHTKPMLERFCDAIALMEGANPANNNEGNCRCSPVGYAPMYGNVKCNPHG